MMLRMMLGSAALVAAILIAPMVVIHAQQYDDNDLHDFLTPEQNCSAPCFMGIQPGATSAGEALNILEAHEWVETVDIMKTPILWTWSGRQPKWIDERVPGHLVTERFLSQVQEDAVVSIYFQSRLSLADLYMLLGPPDQSWFRAASAASSLPAVHAVYYEAVGLQLSSTLRCPVRLENVWRKPGELSFAAVPTRIREAETSEPIFPQEGAGWQRPPPVC